MKNLRCALKPQSLSGYSLLQNVHPFAAEQQADAQPATRHKCQSNL